MVSTLDIIKKSPKIFKLFMLDRKIRNLYDIKNSEKRFAKATKMLADYQNKKMEKSKFNFILFIKEDARSEISKKLEKEVLKLSEKNSKDLKKICQKNNLNCSGVKNRLISEILKDKLLKYNLFLTNNSGFSVYRHKDYSNTKYYLNIKTLIPNDKIAITVFNQDKFFQTIFDKI